MLLREITELNWEPQMRLPESLELDQESKMLLREFSELDQDPNAGGDNATLVKSSNWDIPKLDWDSQRLHPKILELDENLKCYFGRLPN